MQYTYTAIHPPLESVPEKVDLLHDPIIQKTILWFARSFIALAAIGVVLYALALVLHIVVDLVQTIGALINTLAAPIMHANPAGQLLIIIVVLALGYAALRYIISGRKRGVA
jgi:uncharacterized membrane protein YidH (DUF202 family)